MSDPAPAPANFFVTAATENKACTAVFRWEAAVPVCNAVSAATCTYTDGIGLESFQRGPNGDSQWQKFGNKQHYPVNGYDTFVLAPEKVYYFRAYSWNGTVGRGGTTENVSFSTITGKVQSKALTCALVMLINDLSSSHKSMVMLVT